MWQSEEFDASRTVNLVLGAEKVVVQEETSFLATISLFFRTMFYSGFAEAKMDSIELPEFEGTKMQLILENLHQAKNNNTSIDDKIATIISPALFATLSFLAISSNLEKIVLRAMRFHEIEEYATMAEQTGNLALLRATELKSLGFFCEYRKTEHFKKKTIEQLVAYLNHPFLEYSKEEEVLDAVLMWLDFDFNNRIIHLEKVLSCVNWHSIEKIQPDEIFQSRRLRKNYILWDFLFAINLLKTNGAYVLSCSQFNFCSRTGFNLAEKLMEEYKQRQEKKYFLSVPFAYRLVPQGRFKFGVCIYDKESKVFQDQVFLLPNDEGDFVNDLGYVNVVFFDFHVYSFMRSRSSKPPWGYNIEKHSTLESHQQNQWTLINSYGTGLDNRLKLMEHDSLKYNSNCTSGNIPFYFHGDMPLPEVTKDGVNVLIKIRGTVQLNLLTESIRYKEPEPLPNSRTHFYLSLIGIEPYNYPIPDRTIDGFPWQVTEEFQKEVQILAASKVGQTLLDFKVSDKFVQFVNPLWFTKFP